METLPKRISSAAMILETHEGEAIIVKANYKTYWTFPGGVIDPGETPKQGAIRETFEEIGIRVDPVDVEFVAVVDRVSHFMQTYQFIFRAKVGSDVREAIALQASEIDEYAIITKDQVQSTDRQYAKAVLLWVNNTSGYIEQLFEEGEG